LQGLHRIQRGLGGGLTKPAKATATNRTWFWSIHGVLGKGFWTFYGGHDPEDYQHQVGEEPTDLNQHPNSPGYRLILNNVLFPAAKKKKQKT